MIPIGIKDFLADVLYPEGYVVGFGLVVAPYLWDIFWNGAREADLVSIGNLGGALILVGAILVGSTILAERYLRRRTR